MSVLSAALSCPLGCSMYYFELYMLKAMITNPWSTAAVSVHLTEWGKKWSYIMSF